jgi:hypothetical protein
VVLLPCSVGGRRRPWGGTRSSGDGGACSVSAWGGRRRPGGPSGLKGRVGQLAARPIGPEAEKNSFQNKNWIFEFTLTLEICTRRGGILTQGFFLNSSRILKDS